MSIKLNIGCGADILEGYVNIDVDTKDDIVQRYEMDKDEIDKFLAKPEIHNHDIFNLPYGTGSVKDIICKGFLEHLSFDEEKRFLHEVQRVLKKNGRFYFTVPDFEFLCNKFVEAKDDFQDFYSTGRKDHWFGNYSRKLDNRWGYLTASIFGNQNGQGQFHKNAYTVGKIISIMKTIDFVYQIDFFNFKNTEVRMIECNAYKR